MSGVANLPANVSGTLTFGPENNNERIAIIKQTEAVDKTSKDISSIANWFLFLSFIAILVVAICFALYVQNNIWALFMLVILAVIFYVSMWQKYDIDRIKHAKTLDTAVEIMKIAPLQVIESNPASKKLE